jgi:hypothetical protein
MTTADYWLLIRSTLKFVQQQLRIAGRFLVLRKSYGRAFLDKNELEKRGFGGR